MNAGERNDLGKQQRRATLRGEAPVPNRLGGNYDGKSFSANYSPRCPIGNNTTENEYFKHRMLAGIWNRSSTRRLARNE